MRKSLFILVSLLLLMVITVGLASANGGPHGDYTATTDACAGCHRAHTASGAKLLIAADTYTLCITCHGATGAGANTNVDDGIYLSSRDDGASDGNVGATNTPDNSALLGGGFTSYQGVTVTSSHDPAGTTAAAWGNGVARGLSGALADGNLSCASCHDPHGNSNYRMINVSLNGSTVSAAQVDEGAGKDYDTEQWGAGMSTICASCHTTYHVTRAGSGSDNADDTAGNLDYGGDITSFAHRVDMPFNYDGNANPETTGMGGFTLPLAESGTNDAVVCMTCHLPHGTSAQMSGLAISGAPATGDSALLRLDNRGVCEVCHQK